MAPSVDHTKIGFMQGRLSPILNGRIQSFPWKTWRDEFSVGKRLGFDLIEWTIDSENVFKNPLLSPRGQYEINGLISAHAMGVESITCDFFMENPPWLSERNFNLNVGLLNKILHTAEGVGIYLMIIPLVDNSSVKNNSHLDCVLECMEATKVRESRVKILFESDFNPTELKKLLSRLDDTFFGVNLDLGNSAALGWEPRNEVDILGKWIGNVHVKDRKFGGPTVKLGSGDVNFVAYFESLENVSYTGNLILQTARAVDDNHELELERNLNFIKQVKNRVMER